MCFLYVYFLFVFINIFHVFQVIRGLTLGLDITVIHNTYLPVSQINTAKLTNCNIFYQIQGGTGMVTLKREHITNKFPDIHQQEGKSIYVAVSVLTESGKKNTLMCHPPPKPIHHLICNPVCQKIRNQKVGMLSLKSHGCEPQDED